MVILGKVYYKRTTFMYYVHPREQYFVSIIIPSMRTYKYMMHLRKTCKLLRNQHCITESLFYKDTFTYIHRCVFIHIYCTCILLHRKGSYPKKAIYWILCLIHYIRVCVHLVYYGMNCNMYVVCSAWDTHVLSVHILHI